MSEVPTILLVEDNGDDVLLIQRAFRKAATNAQTVIVSDGEAAVAYLAGTGPYADRVASPLPALVLLDLKLPLKSGLEVLEWLRAQPGLRRLPVVGLTSSRESVEVQRAYDLGANSYLVKRVAFDDMRERARALGLYWLTMNEAPRLQGA